MISAHLHLLLFVRTRPLLTLDLTLDKHLVLDAGLELCDRQANQFESSGGHNVCGGGVTLFMIPIIESRPGLQRTTRRRPLLLSPLSLSQL